MTPCIVSVTSSLPLFLAILMVTSANAVAFRRHNFAAGKIETVLTNAGVPNGLQCFQMPEGKKSRQMAKKHQFTKYLCFSKNEQMLAVKSASS